MPAREKPQADGTSRKEDYKAYSERDVDEGWPYSDEPGNEESRLTGNRPYADEELEQLPPGVDGFHVEELPGRVGGSGQIEDEESGDDGAETADRGLKHDRSADPEVDPRPRGAPEEK